MLSGVYGAEYVVVVPLQQGGHICQASGGWLNCMALSSHPGHGDSHTLGNRISLLAKLNAGSQIPSVKGYNIFPCSIFL